jgi:hypothetical protein
MAIFVTVPYRKTIVPSKLAQMVMLMILFTRCSVWISVGSSTILTRAFSDIPQSLQEKSGVVPKDVPRAYLITFYNYFLKRFIYVEFVTYLDKYYVSGHYRSPCFYLKHHPVNISKYNVSETGSCFCLQVKPTKLGPIDKVAQLSRFYLKTEIEFNLRNFVFLNKNRTAF